MFNIERERKTEHIGLRVTKTIRQEIENAVSNSKYRSINEFMLKLFEKYGKRVR